MWVLFALIASFFSAGNLLVNQRYKLSGWDIVLWCRVVVLIAAIPFFFYVPMPSDPVFYIAILVTSGLAFFADQRLYTLIASSDAGAVARLVKLTAVFSFVFWTAWSRETLDFYIAHPWIGGSLAASICVTVALAMVLRNKCEVSRTVLKGIMPAIISYAVIDVLNKTAMDLAAIKQGVIYYIIFQSVGIVVLGAIYAMLPKVNIKFSNPLKNPALIKSVLMITIFWVAAMVFRQAAIKLASSPAYVTTIGLTSPFWISILYIFIGYKEKARLREGILLIISVMIFAYISTMHR